MTAREGQVHHLQRLLDCGALVDGLENNWNEPQQTPLMLGAKFNDEEVVEFLIERGASLKMRDNQDRTPFHYAAEGGKVRNLLRLIEHGVDVLRRDEHGYSALHLAASNGHTNSVRLFIEHGADVNEFTSSLSNPGYTPLMLAAEKGHLRTVQVLLYRMQETYIQETKWLGCPCTLPLKKTVQKWLNSFLNMMEMC